MSSTRPRVRPPLPVFGRRRAHRAPLIAVLVAALTAGAAVAAGPAAAAAPAAPAVPVQVPEVPVPLPALDGAPSVPQPDRIGASTTVTAPTARATRTTSSAPEVPTTLSVDHLSGYRPIFRGRFADGSSREVRAQFAVQRGDGTLEWDTQNTGPVGASGATLTTQPTAGVLRVGDRYTFTARTCLTSGTECSAWSAPIEFRLDPVQGAGDRDFFTYVGLPMTDRISAKVNVGSGNLLLTQQHLGLAGVTEDLALGEHYNSQSLAPGSSNRVGRGNGEGWRRSFGQSLRLVPDPPTGVTRLYGPSGYVAQFTSPVNSPAGTVSTSPAGVNATLTKTETGFTLSFHTSAQEYTFDAGGFLLSQKDRNGNRTTFAYPNGTDKTMASVTGTRGGARTVTMDYDANGRRLGLRQTGGGLDRGVRMAYSAAGDLTEVTDVTGGITRYAYGAAHELTRITDPRGIVTDITYDDRRRVTQVVQDPGGIAASTRFAYTDGVFGSTRVTDPNGNVTTYEIDYAHRVRKTIDARGNTRDKTWTPNASVGTSTSGSGGVTTNRYDANNGLSLTSSTSPEGSVGRAEYPTSSGLTRYLPSASTDASGNRSTYTYAGPGNLTANKDAENASAEVDYNTDGTVKTSTDPGNVAEALRTGYGYTDHQLTSITPPSGNTLRGLRFTYDAFGRIATASTGSGVTRTFTYDAADRTLRTDFSDATVDVTQAYDRAGNVIRTDDATGTTTFTMDALSRLIGKDLPGAEDLRYTYDDTGNLIALRDARGETRYSFDAVNNVIRMDDSGGQTTVFAYDRDNQRTDTWTAVGPNPANPPTDWTTHVRATFDRDQKLTDLRTARDGDEAKVVSDLGYSYAKPTDGSRTDTRYAVTDRVTGKATSYTYDKAMRLTKAATDRGGPVYTYAYDADGNISGGTIGTQTYNSGNQLTSGSSAHDANGNLTSNDRLGRFTYTGADQLTSADVPNFGRQDFQHTGTTNDELVRIGDVTLTNGLTGVQSRTGPEGTTYFERDPEGQLVSLRGPYGTFYYVTDGIGSVVGMVGADGEIAASYTYDPFGAGHTVSGTNDAMAQRQPFRFAGGLRTVGGLHHFGARYYDAKFGRWTQQDPLSFLSDPREGNRYGYAQLNPVNRVDPSGRESVRKYLLEDLDTVNRGRIKGAEYGRSFGAWGLCLFSQGKNCEEGGAAGAVAGGSVGAQFGFFQATYGRAREALG